MDKKGYTGRLEEVTPFCWRIPKSYKKGMRVAYLQEKMYPSSKEPGLPVGEERSKVASEHSELLGWLLEDGQVETKRRFAKYLSLVD